MNLTASSPTQLAEDFKKHFIGKVSDEVMRHTVASLEQMTPTQMQAATSYGASGSLASLVLYVKGQCVISGGKTFNGTAWGITFPGGGALFGDVYLNAASSLSELYSGTTSWTFIATPVYTSFYFYNSSGTLLGNFQAGSVSTVFGSGGGSGNWS